MSGRPTDYDPNYHPQKARELAELDFTDKQIAQFFGIAEKTIYNWKNEYFQFLQAIEEGKQGRIRKIEESALKVALGYYEHEYQFDPNDPIFKNAGEDVKKLIEEIFKKIPKKYFKPDAKILSLMMMSLSDKYKFKTEQTIDPIKKKVQDMTPEEVKARIKELEEKRKEDKDK